MVADCPAGKELDATGEVTKTAAKAEVEKARRTRDDANMTGIVGFSGSGGQLIVQRESVKRM